MGRRPDADQTSKVREACFAYERQSAVHLHLARTLRECGLLGQAQLHERKAFRMAEQAGACRIDQDDT